MIGREGKKSVPAGRGARGNAIIEFAFLLPILLTVLLGMADLALFLQAELNIHHLCREAAGAFSRGTDYSETFEAILNADGDLGLDGPNGRVILTKVSLNTQGNPVITHQETRGSLAKSSRLGTLPQGQSSTPATVPNGVTLPNGMNIWAVEIYAKRPLVAGHLVFQGDPILSAFAGF